MSADISAIIVFHREGSIATTSILSFLKLVDFGKASGLDIQKVAVLDRPDDETLRVVRDFESHFDDCLIVDKGDLGAARNWGIQQSSGKYVAVFDGDDLWGSSWLVKAHSWCRGVNRRNVILHPQLVHYFSAADYLNQSRDDTLSPNCMSFHFIHVDSCDVRFDKRQILFNNLWTSNSFSHREVYKSFPYKEVDQESGFGIEDWMWNAETLAAGIRHGVVEGTVHCVRLKDSNSLGVQNSRQGLLPPLHLVSELLEN